MCLRLFIGSDRELEIVPYKEDALEFYVFKFNDPAEEEEAKENLRCLFVYEAGSFMGCGCGFICGEEMKEELDYTQRVHDVMQLKRWLLSNMPGNRLVLLASWDPYLAPGFPVKHLNVNTITEDYCELEEDVVFCVH